MFGTNPNVGVLNPVAAAKAGTTGKPTAITSAKPGGGMAMGIGGMGIGGGAPPTAAVQKGGADPRGQKSRLVQQV